MPLIALYMVGGWKECQWGVGGSYWSRPAHRFGDITMEGADTLECQEGEGVYATAEDPLLHLLMTF